MSAWAVMIAVPDDGITPETMVEWESMLADFDASAGHPRSGQVDLHLYVSGGDDLLKAAMIAYDAVAERTGRTPVEIGAMTEVEYSRRAEAPTLPELMSAAEIADELGVSRQRVHQLRDTAAFPAPLADLRGGAVWDATAVRKFGQEWTRKPGRPARAGHHG